MLTDLDQGEEYKMRVRARYYNGSYADNPQNWPWKETIHTVSGGAEPTPTFTPTATATGTLTPSTSLPKG